MIASATLLCACLLLMAQGRARAEGDASERARMAFKRGIAASRDAQWLTARAEFKRSIAELAKPSALYNLALADVMLGLGDEALEALGAFAQLAHGSEYAAMIERSKLLRSLATALSTRPHTAASSELMAVPGLDEQSKVELLQIEDANRAGELARALPALEALYERTHRPELLFNLAVTADRLGASARAHIAYQAFAAALPDTPQAATARARVLLLAPAQPQPPVAPASEPDKIAPVVAPERSAPAAAPPRARLTLGIALVAGGSALLAGALGSASWLAERGDERADAAHPPTPDQETVPWRRRAIERQFRAAVGTTAALTLLGLPLTILGARMMRSARRASARPDARLVLNPAELGLAVHGRF